MKKLIIRLVVITLAICFLVLVKDFIPNMNQISKERAIQISRTNAKGSCNIFLGEHINDYNRYILKKGYSPKCHLIEDIKKNVLFFNDSILYFQINKDRFKFKYKIYMDEERYDYKLIEEYIHLDDYKKY